MSLACTSFSSAAHDAAGSVDGGSVARSSASEISSSITDRGSKKRSVLVLQPVDWAPGSWQVARGVLLRSTLGTDRPAAHEGVRSRALRRSTLGATAACF
jgi:hypothetical protein